MRTLNELKSIANYMNKSTEQLLYEMLYNCMSENGKYKESISNIKKICNSVPSTWSVCGTDIIAKIEDNLETVEQTTAKELFECLEFVPTGETENDYGHEMLEYTRNLYARDCGGFIGAEYLQFDKDTYSVEFGSANDNWCIDFMLIKAIYKQMEELGWFDEVE